MEAWTIHPAVLPRREEQALVLLHERLHHELQHTTPWGLVARFAADLARLGVEPTRLARLARFCRTESRTVHETYATTLSVGDDPVAGELLSASAEYRCYHGNGMRLAGGLGWGEGRFLVDAVLRACMAPAALTRCWMPAWPARASPPSPTCPQSSCAPPATPARGASGRARCLRRRRRRGAVAHRRRRGWGTNAFAVIGTAPPA